MNTGLIIDVPFFHRDRENLAYADRFAPELWLSGETPRRWPVIPFSEGPAACPGRELVLLLSTAMLRALLENGRVELRNPASLGPDRPLPGTLNHFTMRFRMLA